MMDRKKLDAAAAATSFARAFVNGDAKGANSVFLALPTSALPGFCAALAAMVDSALSLGNVPEAEFWALWNGNLDSIGGGA